MILHLNTNISEVEANLLATESKSIHFFDGKQFVFVTASSVNWHQKHI